MSRPAFLVPYTEFTPDNLAQFKATATKINQLSADGLIAWDRNSLILRLQFNSEDDVHTLTSLALSNNYSVEVLEKIKAELAGREDYLLFISALGISAGIANSPGLPGSDRRMFVFSIGESDLHGFSDPLTAAKTTDEAVNEIEAWIRHERGHTYMAQFIQSKSMTRFVDLVARDPVAADLLKVLTSGIWKKQAGDEADMSAATGLGKLFVPKPHGDQNDFQLDYLSQEMCDTVFFNQISKNHNGALKRTYESDKTISGTIRAIERIRDYDAAFAAGDLYDLLLTAFKITLMEKLRVTASRINRVKNAMNEALKKAGPQVAQFFDAATYWFEKAYETCGDGEMHAFIREKDSKFFTRIE